MKSRRQLSAIALATVFAASALTVGTVPARAEFNPHACIAKFGIDWQFAWVDANGQTWRQFGWSFPWDSHDCPAHVKKIKTDH